MSSAISPTFRAHALAALLAWLAVGALLVFAGFLVARSCGFDLSALAAYAAYFGFHVVLPGLVLMRWIERGPVSLTAAVALGLPTGFALELVTYLGCAAAGAKAALPFVPALWAAAGAWTWRRSGRGLLRWRVTARHAGIALALTVLAVGTVVGAVCQMFAESPLVAGLPQRPIFHDWVFLVSRAAAIKNLWPFEDPSLAGTSLQYHYFMLVHAAAASLATKLELTLVLLRLMIVPLGFVLVVQAYALGRLLSRSAWGGVAAAWLTVAAGEMSITGSYDHLLFMGLFTRWLYVSPTFFFGMIFFGALLILVGRAGDPRRWSGAHLAWFLLLVAAASGAKGTVVPVLLLAGLLWFAWRWGRSGRFPRGLLVLGLSGAVVFVAIYWTTMAGWGTGAAAFAPFDLFQKSLFWQQAFTPVRTWLEAFLPAGASGYVAGLVCGIAIVAGTAGVRLLAMAYLLRHDTRASRPMREWLGAALVASLGMGALIKIDADGELYLFLLARLPMAVLAAAGFVALAHETRTRAVARANRHPVPVGLAAAMTVIVIAVAGQTAVWMGRNQAGLAAWLRAAPAGLRVDAGMQELQEALLWVREHTERDAVLVANMFTTENLKRDHWAAVDRTLAGVHYYYSALSERRMLVEGPYYLLDPRAVQERMALAGDIFYRRRAADASVIARAPCYAVIDGSARDGATISLPPSARVFANSRIEIFRLPRTSSASARSFTSVVPR